MVPVVSSRIAFLLFHFGVALATVIPRLPNDRPFPFSIGGDLSYNFRRVMLACLASNAIRVLFLDDSTMASFCLRALASFLLSFLCLLTPYQMLSSLQNKINVSRPGQNLMMWVYLVVFMNSAACVLVERTQDARYWCLKKLGDALTFLPVYQTLKLFSSIITPGGRHPGRGDMSGQTLLTVEYLVLISTLLSAAGYMQPNDSHPIFEGFCRLGAYAQMTRLFCHATLMNARDEADYLSRFATSDEEEGHFDAPTRTGSNTSVTTHEVMRV